MRAPNTIPILCAGLALLSQVTGGCVDSAPATPPAPANRQNIIGTATPTNAALD